MFISRNFDRFFFCFHGKTHHVYFHLQNLLKSVNRNDSENNYHKSTCTYLGHSFNQTSPKREYHNAFLRIIFTEHKLSSPVVIHHKLKDKKNIKSGSEFNCTRLSKEGYNFACQFCYNFKLLKVRI